MKIPTIAFLLTCQFVHSFASLTEDPNDPFIASNGTGNLSVLWSNYSSTHFAISANAYRPGSGWQVAHALSTGSGDAFEPDAVMNGSGNMLAAWRQNVNGYYAVYAATGAVGEEWSEPVQISTGESSSVSLGIDENGYGTAVWQQRVNAKNLQLLCAFYTPGEGWSSSIPISGTSRLPLNPLIAVAPEGTAVAVWQMPSSSGPNFKLGIQGAFYQPNFGWSAPVTLSDMNHNSVTPRIAASAAGETLIVWEGGLGTAGKDQVSVVSVGADGNWGAAEILSDAENDANTPSLSVNASGAAMVVWQSKTEEGVQSLIARSRSSEGVWAEAVEVASSGVNFPEVAMNDAGKAAACWIEQTEENAGLIKAAVYSGSTWSLPTQISSSGLTALDPEIRMNADGSGVLVWRSNDLTLGQVPSPAVILCSTLSVGGTWSAPVAIGN